jgi:hypothetical protein
VGNRYIYPCSLTFHFAFHGSCLLRSCSRLAAATPELTAP